MKRKQVAKARLESQKAVSLAGKAVQTAKKAEKAVARPAVQGPPRTMPASTSKQAMKSGGNFNAGGKSASVKPQRKAAVMHTSTKNLDPYLGAIIDPFVLNNNQIKVPDAHNYPSVASKLIGQDKLTTDANGNLAVVYRPWIRAYKCQGTVGVSSIDWTSAVQTDMDKMASYYADFSLARVVAWGVRLGYIGNRSDCQGSMYVAVVPNDYSVSGIGYNVWPTNGEQFAAMPYYEQWQLSDMMDKQLVIPGRPIDIGSQRYRDTAAPLPDTDWLESTDGWSSIVLYFSGCQPNTTIMNLDWSYHMEGLQRCGLTSAVNGGIMDNSPARDFNPTVIAKASKIGQKLPCTYHREDKFGDFRDMIDRLATGAGWDVDVGSILSSVFKLLI